MSVNVTLSAPGFEREFHEDTIHTMADTRHETAEQWARILERIVAELRRMYPADGPA